ncbi:MAG: CHASE2 domain-containing protein [Elusimicrobia bacterium]|nr:CHASE2 domain-containing protein [Elusimicrobiota bacterium]
MKNRAWIADALIGLLLTGFVAGSYVLRGAFLEGLELKAYDARSQLRVDLEPSSEVVIVAIDDDSITRLGRWPWPRTRLAEMLEKLKAAGPRVIGLDILYTEPERNPALAELETMKAKYLELIGERKVSQRGVEFEAEFAAAAERLDTDKHLLAALTTTQNVVLPMFFLETGEARGAKPPELPAALSSSTVSARLSADAGIDHTIEATKATYPLPPFVETSAGVGHVNIYPDLDGVVRRETLVVKYGSQYFPSYALTLVARSLGLSPEEVTVVPGRSITVGKIEVPLDDEQSMLVTFNGPERTFRYYPFYEVLEGKIPADVFKDKIVILGPSAQGVGAVYVTPVAKSLPSVEFIANVIENILNRRFLGRPVWAADAELGAIAVMGLFVMLILPRLRALVGAFVTVVLLAGLFVGGSWAFKVRGEWIKVVYPAFLLGVGYVVIVTKRFFTTERGKELVEASQVDTNKMLGLTFQGQGMLDVAFEKFRTIPLESFDDSFKDTLYNLGLDFERKRQYAKAVQVYKHIETADPKFKDITEKIKTLSAAAEGAVFGGVGKAAKEGTVIVTGGASKPTLGRYEIEKELGRGAMGIVYLGKDPKINRQVAIKTLMLDEGSSPAEVKEIEERFFREAESAGTLNHPGIVRVFDAGKENDVCFIAMELLSGEDLVKYTKKETRLLPDTAMEYVAKVAEALDYAHQQGIVHRDIKPANIMLLKDGSLRVTDFGIARIQASSKTATGTVMGTPSYMSPEQIAGRKVDGRSDLFSLGVTLYELLTVEKPFKGGEGIGALLFQIANDPEPDILTVNPSLPSMVKKIVTKVLAKKTEERYQRGNDLARDLRACIEALKSGAADAPTPEEIAGSISMPEPTAPIPAVEPPAPEAPAAPAAVDETIKASASDWAVGVSEPDLAPAPGPDLTPAPGPDLTPAPAPSGIELGARPAFGAPAPDRALSRGSAASEAMEAAAQPAASGIELGARTAFGGGAPKLPPASGIELGPRPGLGAPPPPAEPPVSFTPEEVAATLSFDATMPAEPPPADEPTAPVVPGPEADSLALVDSIMPRVAPESLSSADITNPNLGAELAAFQAQQAEPPAPRPEAIEPPIDPGETIKLFDPRKPQ